LSVGLVSERYLGDYRDVLGARPLGSTAFLVFDTLTFLEAVVADAFQCRVVEEDISSITLNNQ